MTIARMILRELAHNRGPAVWTAVAVAVAVGVPVACEGILRAHGAAIRQILEEKRSAVEASAATLEDEMRRASLKLSFNLLIVPREQDLREWYAEDSGTVTMPEDYAEQLAQSDIVSIRHLLPTLQRKVKWPERDRTILLVGTRGETPTRHRGPKEPLQQAVAPGTMVLGYELHRSLKLKVGDSVVLFGKPFTLARCNGERGNKDDVTAWISLAEAQELLRQPGRINAILALECLCVGRSGLDRIRRDLARVLPGTQVVENESAVLARAEARTRASEEARAAVETEAANRSRALAEWGRAAAGVAVAAMAACGLWLAVQGARAARARRGEIGVLRAMGLRPRHVMTLLLGRAGVLGLAGGLGGAAAGLLAGRWVGHAWMGVAAAAGWRGSVATAALAVVAAVVLAAVAEWIPGLLAATEDPAEAVRGSEG